MRDFLKRRTKTSPTKSADGSTQPVVSPADQQSTDSTSEKQLKYGAVHIVRLFVPVSVCMLLVLMAMHAVPSYSQKMKHSPMFLPYGERRGSAGPELLGGSVLNVLTILAAVVALTLLVVLCVCVGCMHCFYAYLIVVQCFLFGALGLFFFQGVCKAWHIQSDVITTALVTWNYVIVGLLAVNWKGPLVVQQLYLIWMCVLMTLYLITSLPDWTAWVLLAALALYDLVAVLCPCGPLRLLINVAHKHNAQLPSALIYSTGATILLPMVETVEPQPEESATQPDVSPNESSAETRPTASDDDATQEGSSVASTQFSNTDDGDTSATTSGELSVRLGLGDFIFYSVLTGKASAQGDWPTTVACFVSILVGLAGTLLLLSVYKRPLPALPLSIALGLLFYFSTHHVLAPLANAAALAHVYL